MKNLSYKIFILLFALILSSINAWGNKVTKKDNDLVSCLSAGKVVIDETHATFTLKSTDNGDIVQHQIYQKIRLGNDIGRGQTKNYELSWSGKSGCTITVSKVYMGAWCYGVYKAYVKIGNGENTQINDLNTILSADYTEVKDENVSASATKLAIQASRSNTWGAGSESYVVNYITIEYTVTPPAPTAKQTTQEIYVTLNSGSVQNDEKIALNNSTFFTMPGGDNNFYSYLGYTITAAAGSDASKASVSGNYFSATKVGTYYVQANIEKSNGCHEKSATSTNRNTIKVVRHPSDLTMNDGEVFVHVKDGVAASQLDLDGLIKSQVGDGVVSYTVTSSNNSKATIGTGNIFSATECGDYTISATAQQSALYAQSESVSFKVTVKKITPIITTNPTASAISYQQTLANSTISGGEVTWNGYVVPGKFSWVDNTIAPAAGNSCAVKFTPDDGTRFNAPANVNINVPIIPIDQHIIWGLVENEEYMTGELMDATVSSGLTTPPVTYTVEPSDYASINFNNRLVVKVPNVEIKITAHHPGNDNWNPAPDSSKTIRTKGAPFDYYAKEVSASNITYGDLLSKSELSGDVLCQDVVIPGTIEWVDPMIMPNAGEADHMVLFTPTNTDVYSAFYFEVSVLVNKANPVFRWHISSALHEHTRFHDFVTSSNTEIDFSYSISEPHSAYIEVLEDNVLHTKEVESAQYDLKITATQEATDNYNKKTETKTVSVFPKVTQCLPVVVDNENTMNQMGKVFDPANAGSWCNTTSVENASFLSLVDVKYTQYKGIRLGKWDDGFSGIKHWDDLVSLVGNWNLVPNDKSVELSFTGIPDSISFFTNLQTVQYDFAGWKTAPLGNPTPTWTVYEKSLGGEYEYVTSLSVSDTAKHKIEADLKPTTRFVKIELNSVFAGFAQNVKITRDRYIKTDNTSLTFGTETNPLQDPQVLTLMYSSIGDCDGETDENITITSSNPAFYVDEPVIMENVGTEQRDTFLIRVRCSDLDQKGILTIKGSDGTTAKNVELFSTKPSITSAATKIFETGTEHEPLENSQFRDDTTLVFSACFDVSATRFDTLYIYGVSECDSTNRQWVMDAHKGYKVPFINEKTGNIYTPCFVYARNTDYVDQYDYVRTFDAANKTLDIIASGKKLGFIGYKPANMTTAKAAILLNGAPADTTEVYFAKTEMLSSGVVMRVNNTSVKLYSDADNTLEAAAAAVQLSGTANLTIEDNWVDGGASHIIDLHSAAGYPSIDLGSANGCVTIKGSQVKLHNATHMAIAHMEGSTEKEDGSVHITDGTIIGATTLGMPLNTLIDGGTFNDGTVQCFTNKGTVRRPWNSRGDLLVRTTMAPADLDTIKWYGQKHLTHDGFAKVNPMLADPTVCVFLGTIDKDAFNDENWSVAPTPTSDVLIKAHMVVTDTVRFNMLAIRGEKTDSVTVAPTGGLNIGEGGIIRATKNNLFLRADSTGKTGFLRISPESEEPMPEATIELFSIGYYNEVAKALPKWQMIGAPIAETGTRAKTVFRTSWIYSWDESNERWYNDRANLKFTPFTGYETTQDINPKGIKLTYTGHLVSVQEEYPIKLTHKSTGYNALANSFMAPIDIDGFDIEKDFINADATIHILNAGTKDESKIHDDNAEAPGRFISIPVGSWEDMAKAHSFVRYIPPMQGFFIQATGENAQVILNYKRLVWDANYKGIDEKSKTLRAPKRNAESQPLTGALKITVSEGSGWMDNVYLLESQRYEDYFENGYDAHKIASDGLDVFTINGTDTLAVNATNNMVGTRIGVHTCDTMVYTFTFRNLLTEKELLLLDNETEQTIAINEGTEYTFFAQPNSVITDRFQIIEAEKVPEIATGVDNAKNGVKVHKFIKDNQLYILKDGVLYNAMGVIVR